jgi:hypothetical protein
MMAMTTSSSMSVKPRELGCRLILMLGSALRVSVNFFVA